MRFSRLILLLLLMSGAAAGGVYWWAHQPIGLPHSPLEFTVAPGSSTRAVGRQLAASGASVEPLLFELLTRVQRRGERLKAGTYAMTTGLTPLGLLDKMERGDVVQIDLVIPEGWTFRQMRAAIAGDADLRQTVKDWSDAALMRALDAPESSPEGLFFPDTYRFSRGTSDLDVYRRAYRAQQKRLADAWAGRAADLPLKTPYEALVLASIVEKETGRAEDRAQIAAVFINRLRRDMLLQTDPTVIYGLGAGFDGNLRKRDLLTDGAYNTYTRPGLPPTPISLPGAASITAVLHPANSDVLYFVARGDGSSQFSQNLEDHNRAVNKFQKGGKP